MKAKSSKSKSLGDQVNRHPGVCIGEKLLDDAVDREASPNTSTSGSHHSNQEETSQHCDNQARKARPGELGKEINSIPCIAKSEDRPHRRNGEMVQRRRRLTGLTVSKTRHRHQPRTSHHLQETSQARFSPLDQTEVKSRRGQGMREGADLHPQRRGRLATINKRAEIRHRQGGLQTPARRLARQQSTKAAGRTTLRRLQ